MRRAATRVAACAVALLAAHAPAAAAQTMLYPPAKIAEAYERNFVGERLDGVREWDSGSPAYWASIELGDGHNVIGEPTAALAYADDAGTYWASVNADRNDPSLDDRGNGEAVATLAYLMHKAKGVPSQIDLHITGGRLKLVDYGGGTAPLEAAILLQVWFVKDDVASNTDELFAILTGRGGKKGAETFDWTHERFQIPASSYTESGSDTDIFSAELEIPAQTLTYNFDSLCDECIFEFWVELGVIANNPGGETTAYAYLRDPVHAGDPDPTLGGASITWEGLTPVPEPAAPLQGLVALAGVALGAGRGRATWRGRCSRPSPARASRSAGRASAGATRRSSARGSGTES
jgi:hypothetical protein